MNSIKLKKDDYMKYLENGMEHAKRNTGIIIKTSKFDWTKYYNDLKNEHDRIKRQESNSIVQSILEEPLE